MVRGTTSSTPGDDSSEPKASKRRCVPSACVPCRKRKSKCDGGTPMCATCTAVYKTDCFYDEASETRRGKATAAAAAAAATPTTGTAVKREMPGQGDTSDDAEYLINVIRGLPPAAASALVQRIRRDQRPGVEGLADAWRATLALPPSPGAEQPSLESDLALLMGKPSTTKTGVSRHFGHTSGLGLVPEDENYTGPRMPLPLHDYRNGTWTTITQDIGFVERLLDLYFRWSHPFYVIFSREAFYRDFQSGRQKYCTPLLVNALLAYACHFSDEPLGRTDPANPRTAGDHFFAEARRLLYEDEAPSLTTTQALCVMAMREPSAGRDSSGFMYIGRCMRMAIELGLHLNTAAAPALHLTQSEIEVRKVTFWGCFVVDTVWSLCIGRVSQLPRAAITLDKPIVEELTHTNYGAHQLAPATVTSRMFLQEFAAFSELVNDNNFMFFAPKERFSSRRLLAMYGKYQNWYQNLPLPLHLPERPDLRPLPHFVALHMLYYTVIVHLFRPMLKVDLVGSEVRPRDICIESANKVSDLFRLYRQHYDLRACQVILTHILLSVSIVHLLYSQIPKSSSNLVESLQGLEDLSICHHFGARSFKIVHSLAKTWNLPWPEALKLSKLVPKEDAALGSPPIENLFHTRPTPPLPEEDGGNDYVNRLSAATGAAPQGRRESLSMFAPEQLGTTTLPSIHPSNPQYNQPQQLPDLNTTLSFAPHSANPPTAPASASQHAESLFWTPVPGVGVPIFPREYAVGAMDLNNMLGDADGWDRFGRDGFKMSEAWPTVEPMGYASNAQMHDPIGEAVAYTTNPNAANYPNATTNGPPGLALNEPQYDQWWPASGAPSGGASGTGGGAC